MDPKIPEQFNMADYFLDARISEGRGGRTAVTSNSESVTYAQVQEQANRFAGLLQSRGVVPEQRVLIALPDGPLFVAAFFGILKLGAVVVMVNPELKVEAISYFYEYTRASAIVFDVASGAAFRDAAKEARFLRTQIETGTGEFEAELGEQPAQFENFPSHRDDAAIWLFSGGTTGRPKAVVQTHRSFANTTQCYAHQTLGYCEDDVTLSVPKLFFGYATGSNLLFPFSVGASVALFSERCTAEVLFDKIREHRPTILINVPTMIKKLLDHPTAAERDLSCLRLSTTAGEALPPALHARWDQAYGVDLLDGLGTAEMWHIFLSNRPGQARPGTLGTVVPGFEVKVCDEEGERAPGR